MWGLTLECGHYVERHTKPKRRARCDGCGEGAPWVKPNVVECPSCACGCTCSDCKDPDGSCKHCYGFGSVEQYPDDIFSVIDEPSPGGVPGDHILGIWASRGEDDVLLTVIAKRGRRWVGERRTGTIDDGAMNLNVALSRFYPQPRLSQDEIIAGVRAIHAPGTRHVFLNLKTTDTKRVASLEPVITGYLLDGLR